MKPNLNIVCSTGTACEACRAEDSTFRDELAIFYEVPKDWPVCPHGRPMGYTGSATPDAIIGVGDVIARITRFLGFKSCTGCKKRQATFNKNLPF